jgi:glycine cleavage system H protein
VEVNNKLEETPSHINKDPEGEAWIAKIKVDGEPTTQTGEQKLLSKEEYDDFVGTHAEEEGKP